MWLLASLACTDPPPTRPQRDCPPGPGEIVLLETGGEFLYLDRAINEGSGLRTVCLGEGSYETELDLERTEAELLRGRVRIVGAGSESTVLSSPDGDPWTLRLASDLSLEGLAFTMPVDIEGLSLELVDISVQDFSSEALPARLEGLEGLSAQGLSLSGLEFEGRALELAAGDEAEPMELSELSLLGLRSMTGELAALEHEAVIHELRVIDNVALTNAPGASGITAGRLEVYGGMLSANELNGPVLAPTGAFTASDLTVASNLSRVLGALTLMQDGHIRDSMIADNSGGSGALSLVYVDGERQLLLEDVDMGEDSIDNSPCDIGLNTNCLDLELGQVDSLECDISGCR